MDLQRRVYGLLEETEARSGRVVQRGLIALIIANVAAVMLDSVPSFASEWARALHGFEVFSVAVFTVEYAARVWVAPLQPRFAGQRWPRLRYALTPMAVMDLVAVLPVYLPMLLPWDLLFLRAARILRLLKFGRYSRSVQVLRAVLLDRKDELVATLAILCMVVVLASGLMYVVEHEAQPTVFSSIPATLYWAATTLTTMANGDMRPVTVVGRVLAACVAICGVGLFALPAGILGSGFVEKYLEHRRGRKCPHCGKSLDEVPGGSEHAAS